MKQIPPAIQEEYRYLKFSVNGNRKDLGEVVDAVWESSTKYMGTKGASKADIWIIGNKFNEDNQSGVIKVHRDNVEDLRAALTVNTGFDDGSFLSIEKVSGTISSL